VGNNDRCFVNLLDDGLSNELLILSGDELLLVAEGLVRSSKVLSLELVLSLEKLSSLD